MESSGPSRAGVQLPARVRARAAVVDAGRRDVAEPPARGAQPPLPVLLVARAAQRGIEAADPLERGAPEREVRAPDELGVGPDAFGEGEDVIVVAQLA